MVKYFITMNQVKKKQSLSKSQRSTIYVTMEKCFIIILLLGLVVIFFRLLPIFLGTNNDTSLPMVINTWAFTDATEKAWEVFGEAGTGSVLDAVEQGCSLCEREQCDGTVGYGGSPDENGETTLDAMIMDGATHDVGAVGALRGIKDAISVARRVLENTEHTLLVGSQATQFAISMGFKAENLTTESSIEKHQSWKENDCQPNYWKNVTPDPSTSCGPYEPVQSELKKRKSRSSESRFDKLNHDTIGMIAIDGIGRIAGGTSTNGANNKIPGRVGDSPIPGSGCYVDAKVGGAAATGDGDVMMRLLPALATVNSMRAGMTPTFAAQQSLERILEYYPDFSGALVAVAIDGRYGAACRGYSNFSYSVANDKLGGVKVIEIKC